MTEYAMKRIALINACDEAQDAAAQDAAVPAAEPTAAAWAAANFVLADFKDAHAAYERMSSGGHAHGAGEATGSGAELTTNSGAGPATNASFAFVDDAAQATVAVIAFEEADAACAQAAALSEGTKVYGIRFDQDVFPTQAGQELELTCKQHDLVYEGLLLIGLEPAKVANYQGKPRLGWRRRKLSEATDRLIACVRAGISAKEAADVFGATKKQRVQAARNVIIVQ